VEGLEDRCLLSTSIPLSSSHWTPLGPAPLVGLREPDNQAFTGRISAIAANPTNPNIIYVGAASGGIWKTTNGGQNWYPLTDSQATLNIGSIALAPSNPNIIYVGTGEANYTGEYGQGVLKSTDGGISWTLVGQAQFASRNISAIVVNPTNPDVVYIATAEGGSNAVWKSTNGGQTWSNTFLGAPFNGASVTVSALVMDPTNSQILYAAAGWIDGNSFNGVYRSTDAGATWSFAGNFPHNTGGSNHVGRISLAIAPSAPGTLYAAISDPSNNQDVYQVMKTTNGNTANPANISWQSVGNFGTFGDQLFHGQGWYGNAIIVDPFNANDVFVAGYKVWQSINGGISWTKDPNTPLKIHDDQHTLAFLLPNDPVNHKLLVGTDGGLYRLDNPNNFTFSDLNGLGMQITQFYHIALDPTTADTAYGASQDNGVDKFQDSRTWQNQLCCDGFNVEVSPTNHNRVYANQNGTFFRSDNGGASYAGLATPNGSRNDLYVLDPTNGDRILMGGNAVYESTNAGVNWTPRNGVGWPANASIEAIAIAPSTPNMIYVIASANGSDGTYVTTNDGLTWAHFNSPGNDGDFWSTGLQVDPLNNLAAYALNHSGGRVYRTTNGGQTWTNITGNLPSEASFSLAVTSMGPADSDKVLYVGNDTGVYATCNMGATWSRVSTGLPNAHVTHVEANSNLHVLAAGTYGRGLWELQIGVVAQLQNGTVTISADDCNNVITIQANPDAAGLNVWEGNSTTLYYHLVGFFPAASFSQMVLNEGNGNDTVNIEDTLSGKPLTVNLGSGLDTVNVSPFAENLDHIQGNVTVNGGNGFDTLYINDQNKATILTYTLTNTTWSRPGAAVISSGTLFAAINRVVVNAGSGANVYNVINTTTATTLNTGPGQGTVNVQSTGIASPLTVDTPVGTSSSSQTVRVGDGGSVQLIGGALTIHNQPAYDTLIIDDSADGTNHTNPGVAISASGITGLAPAAMSFTSFSIGSLTLLGGTGTNAYTITGTSAAFSMALTTGAGTNTVNLQATSVTPTLTGNAAGINTLVGPNASTTWHITAVNAGNVSSASASATFSGYRNLTGGSGADNFILSNGAGVTSTIDGGGGANTLDESAYATPVTVDLSANTATGTGGIVNLQSFAGGSATNTLKGPSAATTWNISAANAGTLTGGYSFTAFQNLTGGAGANTFVLANGAGVTGTINGGSSGANALSYAAYLTPVTVDLSAGTATGTGGIANLQSFTGGSAANTLKGPSTATIWNITAANTGTLTGGFSFTAFQNVTSGGGGDRFQFADQATLSGTLTGGGSDTLDYSPYSTSVIVDLQTGVATGVAGGVSGIVNVLGGTGNGSLGAYNLLIGNGANTLTGGTGRRNILVAGGSASTLNSGDQEDLLIGGTTTYDSDPALAAWLQIAAYWAGTDDFATRVANVLSGNGVPILDPTPQTGTVIGNGGGNTMNGTGALALIFSDGLDTIQGFDPNSPIVTISP
jgi:hypothetical protein